MAELSRWIAERLAARGITVEDIFGEDWGWCVMVSRTPFGSQDFRAKEDKGYLLYVVDGDNEESKTRFHEIVSYGVETPAELIPQQGRVSQPLSGRAAPQP